MKNRIPSSLPQAFSLVEVVLALGLISFCILPVCALLPIGLKTTKDSVNASAAAGLLSKFSWAIRHATLVNPPSTTYQALGQGEPFSSWTWEIGATKDITFHLSATGESVSSQEAKFVVHVSLVASPSAGSGDGPRTGSAKVSIAWPATAQWNAGASTWTNAEGSLSTSILFLPKS